MIAAPRGDSTTGAAGESVAPATRAPMDTWDRTKILALLVGAWLVVVWAAMAEDPTVGFQVAARAKIRSEGWLLALAAIELVRQFHYAVSENWAGYHRFWSQRVFGGLDRRVARMDAWNRYRLSRTAKWLVVLVLVALYLGRLYDVPPVQGLFRLPTAVWNFLPMAMQLLFLMAAVVLQFVAIFWFLSKGGVDVYFPADIKTRFSDVWGQDAVLDRVRENLVFLENPESIEEKGGYLTAGILLWGPPGTGKTLMAEAVAGETGHPYVFVDPGAFTNMFMGVGILKVKSLFRKLRKLSLRYGGVIVFFDEADSLGSRGALAQGGWGGAGAGAGFAPPAWDALTACNGLAYTSPAVTSAILRAELPHTAGAGRPPLVERMIMGMGGGGAGMGTLQALLSELSGLKKPRGFVNRVVRRALGMKPKPPPKYRILVMMATNMPQALDEALLRPGRIDRIYKVGYPSKEGRKRTYEGYLAKVAHEITDEQIEKLAVITPYATGATIKDTINEALVVAIRDGRQKVTWDDILKARLIKEHGLPDDFEYIERERHAVALHEACHAVVAHRLRKHLVIDMATIERRGDVGGFVSSIPPEDQFVGWKSEREADIMVSIASLAGERLFFSGDSSEGVGGDLRSATYLAMRMEGFSGMGSTLASRSVSLAGISGSPRAYEDGADRNIHDGEFGRRIEARLGELYDRTQRLLEENRREVLAVTHALELHRTLSGEDVTAIIDGHQGPLVDGREYHQPKFVAMAEAYHEKALAAHAAHSDEALPLPVWAGPASRSPELEPSRDER